MNGSVHNNFDFWKTLGCRRGPLSNIADVLVPGKAQPTTAPSRLYALGPYNFFLAMRLFIMDLWEAHHIDIIKTQRA